MNNEGSTPAAEPLPPTVQHVRSDVDGNTRTATDASAEVDSSTGRQRPRRLERYCLVILATLAVFYTLYFARAILLPTTLAVILSLVLKPLTKRLDRLGLPGMLSATLVLGLFTAVIGIGGRALWEPANEWIAQTPESLQKVRRQLRSATGTIEKIQEAKLTVEEMAKVESDESTTGAPIPVPPVRVQVEQPPLTNQLLSTTGSFATAVTITLSLLFFLLAAGDRFLEKAVQIKKTWREKRDVVMLIKEIESKMSSYLGAITLINVGLGIVIGVGLWLIGMPNPLLWGVLAALLNYIPFAGLVIGTCIVSVVAIAEFDALGHALLAPAIYLGANGVEANIVTPAILGRSISLNPVVILLAVFLGGWIWGVGGIFLAVPILLVLKIACESNESLQPIAVFLSR